MTDSSLLFALGAREAAAFHAFEAAHDTYELELKYTFADKVEDVRHSHRAKGEQGTLLRNAYHELLHARAEWVLARSALNLLRERMEQK